MSFRGESFALSINLVQEPSEVIPGSLLSLLQRFKEDFMQIYDGLFTGKRVGANTDYTDRGGNAGLGSVRRHQLLPARPVSTLRRSGRRLLAPLLASHEPQLLEQVPFTQVLLPGWRFQPCLQAARKLVGPLHRLDRRPSAIEAALLPAAPLRLRHDLCAQTTAGDRGQCYE